MNSRFFIDRPIFAWVIALFIVVLGAAAITRLPVAQYPTVAPPSIVINAIYPGASAQVMEDSVLSVIEQELNGAPSLIYMEAAADASGTGTLTATFEPGTDVAIAQIEVQNRLSRATPRLPSTVVQQGVRVDKARSNFLMFVMLTSSSANWDPVALGDYEHVAVEKELYRERREILLAAVRGYGFELSDSQAGLYLWATLGEDCWKTVDRMAELGIVVVPGTFYGEHSTQHVRFSLTATDEKIEEAANRLRNAVRA